MMNNNFQSFTSSTTRDTQRTSNNRNNALMNQQLNYVNYRTDTLAMDIQQPVLSLEYSYPWCYGVLHTMYENRFLNSDGHNF